MTDKQVNLTVFTMNPSRPFNKLNHHHRPLALDIWALPLRKDRANPTAVYSLTLVCVCVLCVFVPLFVLPSVAFNTRLCKTITRRMSAVELLP
jgi:hypothetical protein